MAGIDGCGSGYQPPVTTETQGAASTPTTGTPTANHEGPSADPPPVAQSFMDFVAQNATKIGKADKAYTQMVFNYDVAKKNMDELARIGQHDA